jgi:hypothetical protein
LGVSNPNGLNRKQKNSPKLAKVGIIYMKQPAAILVQQYWYTILVIPVFYQYLPVSAILVQILVNTGYPVSSRIFQYLQY